MSDTHPKQADLESLRKESLEKDIIAIIANKANIDVRVAMDIYFHSSLSVQIDGGVYGIQYLDAQHLADDLMENESGLFEKQVGRNE
jgi:DNA/RNA endonuclease YhcR with UshA esterase domain